MYNFTRVIYKAQEYRANNKRLCSIELPWTSVYDCSYNTNSGNLSMSNSKKYKTIDFETMVVIFQRSIVNRDPTIYFTHLLPIVYREVTDRLKYLVLNRNCCNTYEYIQVYNSIMKYIPDEYLRYKQYYYMGNR